MKPATFRSSALARDNKIKLRWPQQLVSLVLHLDRLFKKRFIWFHVLTPMVIGFLPILAASGFLVESVRARPWLEVIMRGAPLVWIAFIAIVQRTAMEYTEFPQKILVSIVDAIHQKTNRLLSRYSDFTDAGTTDADKLVELIDEPSMHMSELTHSLYGMFGAVNSADNVQLVVTLAEMENGVVKDFLCMFPQNHYPKSRVDELRDQNSGFSHAARKRQLVVLKSKLEAAGRDDQRYIVTSDEDPDADLSLLLRPIVCRKKGECVYCISVEASSPDYFSKEQKKLYEYMMRPFVDTILLYHYLAKLKART